MEKICGYERMRQEYQAGNGGLHDKGSNAMQQCMKKTAEKAPKIDKAIQQER